MRSRCSPRGPISSASTNCEIVKTSVTLVTIAMTIDPNSDATPSVVASFPGVLGPTA